MNLLGIFYLNQTSNEGLFTEAQIYENINRIVKQLDYKPIGHQTSTLSFSSTATNLDKNIYTIPRFSFIEVGGVRYSFNDDVTFSKKTTFLAFCKGHVSLQSTLWFLFLQPKCN